MQGWGKASDPLGARETQTQRDLRIAAECQVTVLPSCLHFRSDPSYFHDAVHLAQSLSGIAESAKLEEQ